MDAVSAPSANDLFGPPQRPQFILHKITPVAGPVPGRWRGEVIWLAAPSSLPVCERTAVLTADVGVHEYDLDGSPDLLAAFTAAAQACPATDELCRECEGCDDSPPSCAILSDPWARFCYGLYETARRTDTDSAVYRTSTDPLAWVYTDDRGQAAQQWDPLDQRWRALSD